MTSDVVVRRATFADLDEVAALFDDYRAFYHRPRDAPAARAYLQARISRDESTIFVACLDHVVGFTQLYPAFSSISMAPTMILNDLFVAPRARRRGAAKLLIDAAVHHAKQSGAVRLELATQNANDSAIRLYLAMGFVPDHEFMHMSLELR